MKRVNEKNQENRKKNPRKKVTGVALLALQQSENECQQDARSGGFFPTQLSESENLELLYALFIFD